MCVTLAPALISGTQTYVHATTDGDGRDVHVCAYQNEATSFGPNCMLLNFAGTNLELARGPEHTRGLMDDVTRNLEELIPVPRERSAFSFGRSYTIEDYGMYTVVLAQRPTDILSVLEGDEIPDDRRPARTPQLEQMVDFYMATFPDDSFVLACFNGKVKVEHPIVVSYAPYDSNVLTIPGLDGHDGKLPVIGAPVYRGFRCAFSVAGVELPHRVHHSGLLSTNPPWWAPKSVGGFYDNRPDGPNGDYVVRVSDVVAGLTAERLAAVLIK